MQFRNSCGRGCSAPSQREAPHLRNLPELPRASGPDQIVRSWSHERLYTQRLFFGCQDPNYYSRLAAPQGFRHARFCPPCNAGNGYPLRHPGVSLLTPSPRSRTERGMPDYHLRPGATGQNCREREAVGTALILKALDASSALTGGRLVRPLHEGQYLFALHGA